MDDSNTYPVLTLPLEITAEIFGHYTDEHILVPQRDDGPLVLATVCKTWREICFSTCSLWASVMIDDSCNWDEEENHRLLQRWISRAGGYLLDLIVFPVWSTPTSRMFSLLLQHSSQWRTLDFRLEMSDSFPNDMIHLRVPSLVQLEIAIANPDVSGTVTTFREAPCLREVRLNDLELGPSQSISLPYIHPKSLDLCDIPLVKCLELLKEASNLEVLSISSYRDPRVSGRPLSLPLSVILPQLHTFNFKCIHFASDILFNHLTLPSLRTLRLYSLQRKGVPQLFELGTRSSWSLQSIQLSFMHYEASNLCLRSLPSLKEVQIIGNSFSLTESQNIAPLVELLATDDHFLPALCEMAIMQWPTKDISSFALAGMLASRWHGKRQGVARLQSFHLSFSLKAEMEATVLDEINSQVRALKEEGMAIVIEVE